MKLQLLAAVLALSAGSLATAQTSVPASGPSDGRRQAAMEHWKQMTPEEQAAAKARAKAKWDAMTPEQQAAARQHFAEKHPQAAQHVQARHAASAPVAPTASAPAK